MNFIVVTNEWMSAHGIAPLPTMRKSKDGSKIILHEDYFNLVARRDGDGEMQLDGAGVYAHNSPALNDLLAGEEWSWEEGKAPSESADFIQVAAVRNLMTATKAGIQSMKLSAAEALRLPDMYPDWSAGVDVKVGERYNHGGKLWEVVQAHTTQEGWEPGTATLALWKKVDAEGNAGTREDPIPYEQGMALALGKYYTQYGVVYECIQASGPLVYDLAQVPALARPVG